MLVLHTTSQLHVQGRARPSLAKLYNWRYTDLGDLPNVVEGPEYRLANPGFAHEYQFISVPDFQVRAVRHLCGDIVAFSNRKTRQTVHTCARWFWRIHTYWMNHMGVVSVPHVKVQFPHTLSDAVGLSAFKQSRAPQGAKAGTSRYPGRQLESSNLPSVSIPFVLPSLWP